MSGFLETHSERGGMETQETQETYDTIHTNRNYVITVHLLIMYSIGSIQFLMHYEIYAL